MEDEEGEEENDQPKEKVPTQPHQTSQHFYFDMNLNPAGVKDVPNEWVQAQLCVYNLPPAGPPGRCLTAAVTWQQVATRKTLLSPGIAAKKWQLDT